MAATPGPTKRSGGSGAKAVSALASGTVRALQLSLKSHARLGTPYASRVLLGFWRVLVAANAKHRWSSASDVFDSSGKLHCVRFTAPPEPT